MTFERILTGAALLCIVLGIVLVLSLGQVAGWGLIAIGLGAGAISVSTHRRTRTRTR